MFFGLGEFTSTGRSYNGDVVVIVNTDQVTQLQVTSGGRGLGGNTLHDTAVTEEHVSVVVDHVISGLVKDGGGVRLSNGEADAVGEALTEGASSNLNTRRIALYPKTNWLAIRGLSR